MTTGTDKTEIDTDGLLDRLGVACVWLLTGTIWAGVIYLFVMWLRLRGEA